MTGRTFFALMGSLIAGSLVGLSACDDDGDDTGTGGTGTGGTAAWDCTPDKNGWTQCTAANQVQICHNDHFHTEMDCAAAGFTCHEHEQGEAICVDESSTCTDGEHQCQDNNAYNCHDGHWGIEICGTADCHDHADAAHCEGGGTGGYGGGHSFPEEACHEFEDGTPHEVTAVETFSEFPNCHMDRDVPIHITVPDNATSYCHFPVTETGDYVVFMGTADAFETIHHRENGAISPTPTDEGANGECSSVLVEHYHATLEMDGSSPPVPYIIEIKPISGGGEVELIVKLHEDH